MKAKLCTPGDKKLKRDLMPVIVLSNGLRVGNFSSPHTFTFEDGNILPACSDRRSNRLKLDSKEILIPALIHRTDIFYVELEYIMSDVVENELLEIQDVWADRFVDIIIVPLPVLMAIQQVNANSKSPWIQEFIAPFVTGRIKDRITKTLFINKFCI